MKRTCTLLLLFLFILIIVAMIVSCGNEAEDTMGNRSNEELAETSESEAPASADNTESEPETSITEKVAGAYMAEDGLTMLIINSDGTWEDIDTRPGAPEDTAKGSYEINENELILHGDYESTYLIEDNVIVRDNGVKMVRE